MYNRDEIGKRIKAARLEKHLSQIKFAELINVSTPYLSDIENGKTNLSLEIFVRIVEALQVSADWLIMADTPQSIECCVSNGIFCIIRCTDKYNLSFLHTVTPPFFPLRQISGSPSSARNRHRHPGAGFLTFPVPFCQWRYGRSDYRTPHTLWCHP